MDIITLVNFLTPCLPFLVKVGDKIAEGAAQKIGEDTWNTAKAIWAKLNPRIEAKDAAKEAVEDVAKNPEDADSQVVLKKQLEKILEADKALWEEITKILADAEKTSPQVSKFINNIQNSNVGVIGDNADVKGGINFGTKPGV